MRSLILAGDSVTGWVASAGASIVGVTTAVTVGNLSQSLIASFSGIGSYITYTFTSPISVGDYEDLVLHVMSQFNGSASYKKADDFDYKIDFGESTKEYYLPVFAEINDASVHLDGVLTIDRIRITKLTAGADNLVLAYFNLHKQELPLDIFQGIKEQIEYHINKKPKILVGTVSCTAGDKIITFASEVPFLERYAVVELTNGTLTETHLIGFKDGLSFQFEKLFSGSTIINTMAASVYLLSPVTYGTHQQEILLPSISIGGMEDENEHLTSGVFKLVDTFKTDGTFLERKEGLYQKYALLIDIEARSNELIAKLAYSVRQMIGGKIAWVGGRKVYVEFESPAVYADQNESFNVIPKLEYVCVVKVKEDIFDRETLHKTTTIDFASDIQG